MFRYGRSLALFAVPCALNFLLSGYFKKHPLFAPLIGLLYLLAMIGSAWWGGYLPGVLVVTASMTAALFVKTGRVPITDTTAIGYGSFLLLSLLVSSVAASRRKVEEILRLANEGLEAKVRERTAELERARDWLQITLASIGDAVIATDAEGKVSFLNGVAQSLTGWPGKESLGLPLEQIFCIVNEETRATVDNPVLKVLRSGMVVGLANHTVLISRDRREIPIDDSAAPILTKAGEVAGVVLIFRDIAERRQAELERERLSREVAATEERLRETAKLESLGVLAGGIAHDFNNLLVGILGNASLAQEMLPLSSPVLPVIANVVGASEKAAQLTHQMLAYSGKGRFIIERVDLSHVVEDILPLISRPIPKSVSVHLRLGRDLPAIEADKSQLQQILMNLVINAAEACGTQPGSVVVTTRTVELNSRSIPPAFGLEPIQPGAFVCLEIKDTGEGMSEEVKAKIFDPFFTTKFTGRGLGLSAVLGIVRSHKGTVHVESASGSGTTFRIFFPAVAGKVDTGEKTPAAAEPRATGTILVVDDEEIVRGTAKLALERSGYRVLLAEDGEAAVRVYTEFQDRISGVILDLTMPGMDGEAALAHLQKIEPGVKVLLSSGFNEMELAERFEGKGLAGFLQKPYTAQKLLHEANAAFGRSMPASQ